MFGLDSIGNMFGLDKLFNSLGMPWMSDVLSLAGNFMTGNWLGAAKDVFDLVSQFSNSWTNKVDPFQPVGPFGSNSSIGGDIFSTSRIAELSGRAGEQDPFGLSSASRALFLAHETVFNSSLANENVRNAAMRYAV